MKMKFKLSNRILSLVLALVMVVGLLPMTSFKALAATSSSPKVDDVHIYANGTALYIEAGPPAVLPSTINLAVQGSI